MSIDKSKWGDGPWQTEPDVEHWVDDATGYTCAALRTPGMGHWCGYVALPEGHRSHGQGYDDIDAQVHGGLTYAEPHEPGDKPDGRWWVGFDCAHLGDLSPGSRAMLRGYMPPPLAGHWNTDTYRDLPFVKTECTQLAAALGLPATAAGREEGRA